MMVMFESVIRCVIRSEQEKQKAEKPIIRRRRTYRNSK